MALPTGFTIRGRATIPGGVLHFGGAGGIIQALPDGFAHRVAFAAYDTRLICLPAGIARWDPPCMPPY
jgi:hypothetical protein